MYFETLRCHSTLPSFYISAFPQINFNQYPHFIMYLFYRKFYLQLLLHNIATICKIYQSMSSSVQFSCSVMSDYLHPHGLQHTRFPCPSPTPRACSYSCPLSQRYDLTISSSVIPFSCLQSFTASGSFPMNHFFTSSGQVLELQLQHQSFQ